MITPLEQITESLDLDRFFRETSLEFDLRQGVIWNPAKTRVCLLSTDLISGVYKALVDEAGPAWKLIFKNCGRIWGERVAHRLDRECQLMLGYRLGEMVLEDYLKFTTDYFQFHGWGRLKLNVGQARETGIIEAKLEHSIFAEIVKETDEMADPMICGILSSMLSYMSGHEVDCVQTSCVTKGSDASRFILTGRERLKTVDALIQNGMNHVELMEKI